MSLLTNFLKLFKYDPVNDKLKTFNINQALNENWDKIDVKIEDVDTSIGDMTVDDTLIPSTDTGLSVKILLSWLANMIKSITGKASWRIKPTKNLEELNTTINEHKADTMSYSTYKLNPDSNGIFTEIQYKRPNGTLIMKSILSGGTSPKYTTRTEMEYEQDGVTVKSTRIYTITYADDKVTSEVLQ